MPSRPRSIGSLARNCEHAPLAKGRRNEHRKSFRAGDFRVCYSRARPALILQAMFPCRGCGPHHSGFEGSAFVRASLGRNVFEASPKKPRANPALALMAPALCRRRALISQLEMQVPRHLSYKSVAIWATDHAAMAAWRAAASGTCRERKSSCRRLAFDRGLPATRAPGWLTGATPLGSSPAKFP